MFLNIRESLRTPQIGEDGTMKISCEIRKILSNMFGIITKMECGSNIFPVKFQNLKVQEILFKETFNPKPRVHLFDLIYCLTFVQLALSSTSRLWKVNSTVRSENSD